MSHIRAASAVVLAIASLFGPAALAQTPAPTLKDVRFSLDFIPLGRFAEFYLALGKGYYRDAGLNVTISTGKGTADGINSLESGLSDIGFVDIPSLVAVGAASSVKVVAVIYEKAPYCIFSLNPGANVSKPADMAGLELGSSSASFVPRIHQAFMRMHGLDPTTLKVVNVEPSARASMLITKQIRSADLYIMSEPSLKSAAGAVEVKCFLLADYGLDLYGSGIGATEAFLKKDPDTLRKFVRASLQGLRDTLRDPEEAARIQTQFVKALDPKIIVQEIGIVKRLAVVPDTEENGLGWFSPARMKKTVDFMNANIDVPARKLSAEELYREGYLPDPPIKP